MRDSSPRPASSRALVRLLGVAVGVTAANLYYAQPLADAIARDLHGSAADVGTALTLTQIGYTLGMIVLVPLGDGRERRGTIVATAAAAVGALLFFSTARSMPSLQLASVLIGVASSVVQMMVPYAVSLGSPPERGRIVGTVMAGLLTGILLSRTASGIVGQALGWRSMYWIAAGAMATLTVTLHLVLPTQRPAEPLPWIVILRSLRQVFLSQPVLRRHALVGALGMASFSVFWSMLSFHLATIGHGSAVAGMFGIIGVVGVVAGPVAGRLAVRTPPARINVLGLGAVTAAFVVFFLGAHSLIAIGIGVVLLDVGVQSSHLANQTAIYGLSSGLRNRLNALYMVSYFLGGSVGTFGASTMWARHGWPAVCALGATFALLGILPLLGELGSRNETSVR